jgi:hypothetical protein
VNMPTAVAPNEPSMCAPIATKAQPNCASPNRLTTSEENVENVVSPPRKPVMTNNLASGGKFSFQCEECHR